MSANSRRHRLAVNGLSSTEDIFLVRNLIADRSSQYSATCRSRI